LELLADFVWNLAIVDSSGTLNSVKTRKRLAEFTPEENHAWEFAFCFYLENGKTDLQADKLAWLDIVLEFPRLAKFDGCK
jgi:hypothetical protein